ncbi:MAG: proton-conducting transporter membrane subunit, partial [Candidatus Bathyarchaeota archaeon]|nr:proton-conducting transporter membrane subunit [Candidatus Bathyarchaeota archaeon]
IGLFYSNVLWENVSLFVYEKSLPPEGACLDANALSMFMTIIFLTIGIMASLFSFREINRDSVTGYYTVLLGMITAMIGIVFSGDLFTLFIFWEVMCICSYTLVAFKKEKWEAIEASYKYLIMSSAGSITILFALSFLYGLTGTLNIAYVSMSLAEAGTNPVMYIALLMLIVGFGLQAGMFPFHMWLPDAHMAAPSAVSAVLSGVMVTAGVYGLFKVLLTIFAPLSESWSVTLAVFAVLTMFVGNLSALLQDDLKRLLAYSTIANTGYVLLGIIIGSHRSLTGSLFHILNHAVIKALLFLCVGAFIDGARTRSLKELAGIRRTMPIAGTFFIIGALSLASFPSLNIFWSEFMIIIAGLEAGMAWLSLLMVVNLVFSAAYCLRMIQTIGVKKATATSKKAKEAPLLMLVPIAILGVLSVLIGIYPAPFQTLASTVAHAILNPG